MGAPASRIFLTPRNKDLESGTWNRAAPLTNLRVSTKCAMGKKNRSRPLPLTRQSSATAGGSERGLQWECFHISCEPSKRPAVGCSDWLDGWHGCWSPLHNDPLSTVFGERKCLKQSNLTRLSTIQLRHTQIVIAEIIPIGLRADIIPNCDLRLFPVTCPLDQRVFADLLRMIAPAHADGHQQAQQQTSRSAREHLTRHKISDREPGKA